MRPGIQEAVEKMQEQPVIPRFKDDVCYELISGVNYLTKALKQEANGNPDEAAESFAVSLEYVDASADLFKPPIERRIETQVNCLSMRALDTSSYDTTRNLSLETPLYSLRGDSMAIVANVAEHIENDNFSFSVRKRP